MTKLIVGLGNPAEKFLKNRHNIGFMIVDKLINYYKCKSKKCNNDYIAYQHNELLLLKPLTYMNTSGKAVKQAIDEFDIQLNDILIIYDDISLPLGKLRIKNNSSAGGHNGIKSIIEYITKDFTRLKIGVNPPPNGIDLIEYVLSDFDKEELNSLDKAIDLAQAICVDWIENNTNYVMNKYNGM